MNLKYHEDRQLLKAVLTLTDVEPGVNFKLSNYHKKTEEGHVEVHGWELPLTWLTGMILIY